MKITRRSPFSGNLNTREINCSEKEYDSWLAGELIQIAMPNVSSEDREFVLSGITPEEWEEAF